jgi:hypothetical protein
MILSLCHSVHVRFISLASIFWTANITLHITSTLLIHNNILMINLWLIPYYFLQSVNKVKCTLVQALRLCTGCMAHRGSRGIALPFRDHGTRRGKGVSVMAQPLFTPGKDPVPIVKEAGRAPGPVWTGAENLAPTGIRSLDRPARNQLLYWLHYPAHTSVSDLL